MRPCFNFKAAATAAAPHVLALDDEIGFWGTQAKDFRNQLDGVTNDNLDVEINSPGGEVMAGLGIYNMLRTWANAKEGRTVTTRVTGLAASIASVIALAGDKREMPKNTFAMVHQASGLAWGTADDMRDTAEVLDKMDGSIRNIYVDRMGIDEVKAKEIMAKDTWLTAEEAKDLGFATDLTDDIKATAKFDLARADLPENVAKVFNMAKGDPVKTDPEPTPDLTTPVAKQIHAAAISAGLTDHADFIAVAAASMEEAEPRIKAAAEIVALCAFAKCPDDAKALIRANKTVVEARAAIVEAQAKADVHVDTTKPEPKPAFVAKTSNEVYAERQARKTANKRN